MTRDRLLRPRWLACLAILWGVATAATPRLGEALPLPSTRTAASPDAALSAPAPLEHHLIQARLAALGVSSTDVAELWARLTPAERQELAARADELEAGGDPVAAAVAIAIVLAMVVILALELMGRRVISRP